MEAIQLIDAKGAFSIKNYDELSALFDKLIYDEKFLRETGNYAGYYVTSNAGATDKVLSKINF
jgi:3-deoxy-D-manno-octulosonic-acid transferase